MKQKILFDITLPATQRHYDFWVPTASSMQDVTSLVSEAMQVIEPDFYRADEDAALMLKRTGEIQSPNATVYEIGFANGEQFLLL